jgi:hypothetical protein
MLMQRKRKRLTEGRKEGRKQSGKTADASLSPVLTQFVKTEAFRLNGFSLAHSATAPL